MLHRQIENVHIEEERVILSPDALKHEYPLLEGDVQTVQKGQTAVKAILDRSDPRLLVIVGPCSIHDPKAALEYAQRLNSLAAEVSDELVLLMRVYFEKPRTTVGWQGLVNDPHLDQSFDIETGLRLARKLLLQITRMGLPVATEALDIVTPPYIQDLISYTAIGARTVESQSHRKMASGLTSAVGFKNATSGDISVAIHAIQSAARCHNFISINPEGHAAIIRTRGNPHAHLILRGGVTPNYERHHIRQCELQMKEAGIPENLIVDFSHGNSMKDPHRQAEVAHDVCTQIADGVTSIRGVMIESNLMEGNQAIPEDLSTLQYGVSITDACIGWERTEAIVHDLHRASQQRQHPTAKQLH